MSEKDLLSALFGPTDPIDEEMEAFLATVEETTRALEDKLSGESDDNTKLLAAVEATEFIRGACSYITLTMGNAFNRYMMGIGNLNGMEMREGGKSVAKAINLGFRLEKLLKLTAEGLE